MTKAAAVAVAGLAVVISLLTGVTRAQSMSAIAGVVEDERGRAVAAARVTLAGAELRGSRSVVTDAGGRFAFLALPAGRFTLTASKAGHARTQFGARSPGKPGRPVVLVAGQRLDNLTVTLPHGSVITGTVLDTDGTPAAGVAAHVLRVVLQDGARRLAQVGGDTTDDRGIYRIYQLPPGQYFVSATLPAPDDQFLVSAPVYFPGTAEFAAAVPVALGVAEQRHGVDIPLQLQPLVSVAGLLRMPGAPSACSASVALVPAAGSDATLPPGFDTVEVDDGRFEFSGVAPGRYRVVARCGLPSTSARSPVPLWAARDLTVGSTDIRDIVLPLRSGMSVSGRVVLEASQAPPPASRLRVMMTERSLEATELGGATHVAEVAPDGRFAFSGLPPGRYHIDATASGGATDWNLASAMVGGRDVLDFPFDVAPNDAVAGLVLRLSDRTQGVIGRLVDAMNQPVAEYSVVAFPADARYWIAGSRRLQAVRVALDGTFAIHGLPPGDYRLAPADDHADTDWEDPALLPPLVAASVPVTVTDGAQASVLLRIVR